MTAVDVKLRVSPPSAMSQDELRSWCLVVAGALGRYSGSVTATLVPQGEQFELADFHWSAPGSWLLRHANETIAAPLRNAALEALRAAGKDVIG